MAQQAEVLADKLDYLGSISGTHRTEGESRHPQISFSHPHVYRVAWTGLLTLTHTMQGIKNP